MSNCVRVSHVREALANGVPLVLRPTGQRAAVAVVVRDLATGAEVLLMDAGISSELTELFSRLRAS